MGRGGDNVGVRHGARMHAAGHQASEVGHVDHKIGLDTVGDGLEGHEIDLARNRRR